VYRFNLSLDAQYPVVRDEAQAAAAIVMPSSKASVRRHPRHRLVWVDSCSKHWPCLFPQHGRGVKHLRRIELEDWQRAILDRYPWRFLRGLIHSDGSRHWNTIKRPNKTYRYTRYEFSNRSDDISRALLRVLRQGRRRVAPDEPVEHPGRAERLRRVDGSVHRTEAIAGPDLGKR
jgi:hypothetical protein